MKNNESEDIMTDKKNKPSRPKKTTEELQKASEALYYEISMLNECAEFSRVFKNIISLCPFLKNVVIESFCVHLRNMIEFFGEEKKDYVTYNDFILPHKIVAFRHNLSKKYNKKINNLLSHLTFERLKSDQAYSKWELCQIANEVNENFREFFKNADMILLCDNLKNDNISTSNTTKSSIDAAAISTSTAYEPGIKVSRDLFR